MSALTVAAIRAFDLRLYRVSSLPVFGDTPYTVLVCSMCRRQRPGDASPAGEWPPAAQWRRGDGRPDLAAVFAAALAHHLDKHA